MGKKANIREARRARHRKKNLITNLKWVGLAIGALLLSAFILWNVFRPGVGQPVPIMANAGDHVAEGANPGPFNSDPPTSGQHYTQEFEAGFFDEDSVEAQLDYPEGYLIHNLEHGYVIFWYNCNLLDESGCRELKSQIKTVMEDFDNYKVIGFPRDSIDTQLVMTSWGRIQSFESFDADLASKFISSNRNKAPEPNAP